jgi:hypothetical protein
MERRNLKCVWGSVVVAAFIVGLAPHVKGDVIQYRQGALPDGSYAHLGTEISQAFPNWQMGGDDYLRVGRATAGDPPDQRYGYFRALLGFDLVGIPQTATITDVTLSLMNERPGEAVPGVDIYGVTAPGALVEGNGAYATANGSGMTWTRYDATNAWVTLGGDYSPTALGTIDASSSSPTAVLVSSTPALVAAAQSALNGGSPLNMIVVPRTVGFGNQSMWVFASDDYSDASQRPMLTVTYNTAVPLPSSGLAAMAALGLLGLTRVSRRSVR